MHSCGDGAIELGSDDVRGLVALVPAPTTHAHRLGAKSPDACGRYERGDTSPTLEELSELMAAVAGGLIARRALAEKMDEAFLSPPAAISCCNPAPRTRLPSEWERWALPTPQPLAALPYSFAGLR